VPLASMEKRSVPLASMEKRPEPIDDRLKGLSLYGVKTPSGCGPAIELRLTTRSHSSNTVRFNAAGAGVDVHE